METQTKPNSVNTSSNEFNKQYPDNPYGLFDFLTQDELGNISSKYTEFRNTLNALYYHSSPEDFETIYNNYIGTVGQKNHINRRFIGEVYGETRLKTIKRIYNTTKVLEENALDTRDPRFVFISLLWVNTWRS